MHSIFSEEISRKLSQRELAVYGRLQGTCPMLGSKINLVPISMHCTLDIHSTLQHFSCGLYAVFIVA